MSRLRRWFGPLLLGLGAGALGGVLARGRPPAAPKPLRVGGPLDDVNDGFHDAYDAAREGATLEDPVLIVLVDSLVLHRRSERRAVTFTPPLFHAIKSAAHAPLSLFTALEPAMETQGVVEQARVDRTALAPAVLTRIAALRDRVGAALSSLETIEDPSVAENVSVLLRASLAFAEEVLARGVCTATHREAFARSLGPALLRSTDDATRIQLDALNAEVGKFLLTMSAEERGAFHVVVAGDHQARARSLGMQYFGKLLGEAAGTDKRVTYAEGVVSEEDALALVGTHRLDRSIAVAFFGDPTRLQRDVLGDAVLERLGSLRLPPL